MEKKEKRDRQRAKSVGREEKRGGGSEGVRREKKNKGKRRSKGAYYEKD